MARPRRQDARFDFRGGVNTSFSEDTLTTSELRRAENGRLDVFGAVVKRRGSQRIHTSGLAAPVDGLFGRYDAPSGRQVVVLAGGRLWFKDLANPLFTQIPTVLPALRGVRFQPVRVGANIELYFTANGLHRWDGTTVTTPASASAPAGVTDLALYKSRLFAIGGKRLYWSQRAVPSEWTVDALLGGFADIETFDQEPLIGLARSGGSLLLFKEDSIARYRGASIDDVRIDTETEGVSAKIGCIARQTIIQLPEAIFFLSAEGPYIATEAGVQEVGLKIERDTVAADATWADSHAVYHATRREVWLTVPTGTWVWNLRTNAWSGPWTFPVTPLVWTRFEDAAGAESVLSGAGDGTIRLEDTGTARDDRLFDGTGGTPIALDVTLPPLFFGDPGREKILAGTQYLQADLGAAGAVTVTWSSEVGTGAATIVSAGPGRRSYPFELLARGHRLVVQLRDATADVVELAGLLLDATLDTR